MPLQNSKEPMIKTHPFTSNEENEQEEAQYSSESNSKNDHTGEPRRSTSYELEAPTSRFRSPKAPSSPVTRRSSGAEVTLEEVNGRERLKRHRVAVAGRVRIPDTWGREELLKDWIDCTAAFDASLVHRNIISARAALVEEGRTRASSNGLRIENKG